MSARNPTEYATPAWNALEPGDYLEYTELDQILDGQEWAAIAPQVVIADCFASPLTRTSTSYVTTPTPYTPGLRSWRVEGGDLCGIDGSDDTYSVLCTCYVLAWVSDGSTDGTIRIGTDATGAGAGDNVEIGITLGSTAPTWYSEVDLSALTNGSEETFTLDCKRIAGSGTVHIGGILIVATGVLD